MTVKELIEALNRLPRDFEVEILGRPFMDGSSEWEDVYSVKAFPALGTVQINTRD